MDLNRLPTSAQDTPELYASVDNANKVTWTMDAFSDKGDLYRVWRSDNRITVSTDQWYHSTGEFKLIITDLTPEQAVIVAHNAAALASAAYEGAYK